MIAIRLTLERLQLGGELFDTPAAVAIAARLPLEVALTRWGDEYYGSLDLGVGPFVGEKIEEMEVGDLAYWEPGDALCLFFGPTPVSRGGKPRAASPVHRIGAVRGDWARLRSLGGTVRGKLSTRT